MSNQSWNKVLIVDDEPKYRAMPCSHDELIRLARRQGAFIAGHERAKALL